MIELPALPPPAVVAPAPREVSFGLVSGTAPPGTRRVVVHVGARVAADRLLRGRSFSLRVRMPAGRTSIRVTTIDSRGRRSSRVVDRVYALPPASAPLDRPAQLDGVLASGIRRVLSRYRGTHGVYVQSLRTGRGASWNAGARFPAGSTLKLAIAVTVLRSLEGKPDPGSRLAALLDRMLVTSDNAAANELEVWLGGSTSAGSDRVDETMRALGLRDSLMYGGYETTRRPAAAGAAIPIRVEIQPRFGVGKYTTAADLARLASTVYLAGVGKGPLLRLGVSGSEARHLLWLLAQVGDRGKLGRFFDSSIGILHKAGWLPSARHDYGIVVYERGAFVASVLTWQSRSGDRLAGEIALAAYQRFTLR